jgi:hypothetical protein
MTALMQEVLQPIASINYDTNEPANEFAYKQLCTTQLVLCMVQAVSLMALALVTVLTVF